MKAIFAGTPEFADVALRAMLAARIEVPLVLTQPDRPAGRGLKLQASPVKQTALANGIVVAQPRSLKLDGKYPEDAAAARAAITAARADVMVVAAYGLILPQWVLDAMSGDGPPLAAKAPHPGQSGDPPPDGGSAPCEAGSVGAKKLGCLNIHGSLLPRWRGAAPIHRAIEAGDDETGITIMQMDAGLDTGDMLLIESLPIAATDSTAKLHDKLAALGGRLIVEALELAACGGLSRAKQPEEGVTYAHKIDKGESRIDWSQSAQTIERKIRALDPFPGCTCTVSTPQGEEVLKLWRSETNSKLSNPDARKSTITGQILALTTNGIEVQTGDGTLLITELQRPGGKRLKAAEVLRGLPLQVGQVLA